MQHGKFVGRTFFLLRIWFRKIHIIQNRWTTNFPLQNTGPLPRYGPPCIVYAVQYHNEWGRPDPLSSLQRLPKLQRLVPGMIQIAWQCVNLAQSLRAALAGKDARIMHCAVETVRPSSSLHRIKSTAQARITVRHPPSNP